MASLCFPTSGSVQGQEVNPSASAAAGQGGVQAVCPHGGVHDEGPARPDPHPASPGRHGPTAASGQCFITSLLQPIRARIVLLGTAGFLDVLMDPSG